MHSWSCLWHHRHRLLGTKLQCTSGHVCDITDRLLRTKLQCTPGHVYDITDTDCWAQNCNALAVMFVTSLIDCWEQNCNALLVMFVTSLIDCWEQNCNALVVMFATSLTQTAGHKIAMHSWSCLWHHWHRLLGTKLQCTRGHVCATTNVDFQETGWEIVWKKREGFLSIFLPFLSIWPMMLLWFGFHSNRGKK